MTLAKKNRLNQLYSPCSICIMAKCHFNPLRNGILSNLSWDSFQEVDLETPYTAQTTL